MLNKQTKTPQKQTNKQTHTKTTTTKSRYERSESVKCRAKWTVLSNKWHDFFSHALRRCVMLVAILSPVNHQGLYRDEKTNFNPSPSYSAH